MRTDAVIAARLVMAHRYAQVCKLPAAGEFVQRVARPENAQKCLAEIAVEHLDGFREPLSREAMEHAREIARQDSALLVSADQVRAEAVRRDQWLKETAGVIV
jgi:hypothetical protein